MCGTECYCIAKLVELSFEFVPGDAFLPWFVETSLHLSWASHFAQDGNRDREVVLQVPCS
jgi:hypothetical protein